MFAASKLTCLPALADGPSKAGVKGPPPPPSDYSAAEAQVSEPRAHIFDVAACPAKREGLGGVRTMHVERPCQLNL